MEQTTQQISQKPPFPIKTKIAAWWMLVSSIIQLTIGSRIFDLLVIAFGLASIFWESIF